MNFLFKIEDLLNNVLFWIGGKLMWLWSRVCPAPVMRFWQNLGSKLGTLLSAIKGLPARLKSKAASSKDLIKIDYKGVFAMALDAGQKAFEKTKQHSPLKAVFMAIAAPFTYLFQWASSLKPAHFVILFIFTTASFMSVTSIIIQSKKILETHEAASRAPAAAEVDTYSRPAYHKRNERELSFNNVKIPVYVTGVNELRALIIDFSVVTSNRATKIWLEKNEFQMRDHLVHTLEPVLPAFPMSDEGRTMLTDKLQSELNAFLHLHNIEGEIKEARLVYILAH